MSGAAVTLLLVEDDAQIRRFVRNALEREGYKVREAASFAAGLIDAGTSKPAMVILDLGLPDGDGQQFVRELRGWSQMPVLILSARTIESEKIDVLDAGADDYLTKPFSVGELLARVRVLLRRASRVDASESALVTFGEISVDMTRRLITRADEPVHMTAIKYRLLVVLIANAGKVVTRADRKRARLKYVVADWGIDKFREVFVRDYWPKPLAEAKDAPITNLDLHLGWHGQGDGKWFVGLSVENGRVKDDGAKRLRSGLRAIAAEIGCTVRATAQQDILLCDIDVAKKARVDELLGEYGIPRAENLSMVRKWSMACPAIPTCPLAITESERALPTVITQMENDLKELGLDGEPISVRMTGCPNGCARPYQSEVGLVGRGGTKYTMFIGGDSFGRRMNAELQDSVPIEQIAPKLKTIFTRFKQERTGRESFGDYCSRVGLDALRAMIA